MFCICIIIFVLYRENIRPKNSLTGEFRLPNYQCQCHLQRMISLVTSKHILPPRKKSVFCTLSSLPAFASLCHCLQMQLFYGLHSHMMCVIHCDVFPASPLTKYIPERGWIFKIVFMQIPFPLLILENVIAL